MDGLSPRAGDAKPSGIRLMQAAGSHHVSNNWHGKWPLILIPGPCKIQIFRNCIICGIILTENLNSSIRKDQLITTKCQRMLQPYVHPVLINVLSALLQTTVTTHKTSWIDLSLTIMLIYQNHIKSNIIIIIIIIIINHCQIITMTMTLMFNVSSEKKWWSDNIFNLKCERSTSM